jgi:hypothetical protein
MKLIFSVQKIILVLFVHMPFQSSFRFFRFCTYRTPRENINFSKSNEKWAPKKIDQYIGLQEKIPSRETVPIYATKAIKP